MDREVDDGDDEAVTSWGDVCLAYVINNFRGAHKTQILI